MNLQPIFLIWTYFLTQGNGFFFFFFNWDSLHARLNSLQEKEAKKRLHHTGNLFRKNLQLKMSVNSRLKATKIIAQRRVFYRQRIPESSCARKETIDIDILVTSKNGDRNIMQCIRITSQPPSRKRKWNQLSQF